MHAVCYVAENYQKYSKLRQIYRFKKVVLKLRPTTINLSQSTNKSSFVILLNRKFTCPRILVTRPKSLTSQELRLFYECPSQTTFTICTQMMPKFGIVSSLCLLMLPLRCNATTVTTTATSDLLKIV